MAGGDGTSPRAQRASPGAASVAQREAYAEAAARGDVGVPLLPQHAVFSETPMGSGGGGGGGGNDGEAGQVRS
eukprot:NODE_3579_length_2016_cov_4.341980.p9 GENE.NODE_3579_length_2016_cov_4.341980~~NODE_3579_length_2016_cov_4.341980.p9  ORF type:complete len:73 (+),score=22.97 NODE_3579_length_2016_cov_4.341980:895-1113(+)